MNKLTVLFVRVSTDAQNVIMQVSAANDIMKKIPEGERLVLIEDGVSANKVKLKNRIKLQQLLSLIRSGKVKTLVLYDRDRLARNFYEYLEIVRILYDHNVEVIFTGTNVRPFDRSLVVEAISAMFAQLEGQTIIRRRSDTQNQYPSNLVGYKRVGSSDGNITFEPDEHADNVAMLFEDFSLVETLDDFINTIKKHKRLMTRSEVRLLGILRTPFYAGVWERNGAFQPLEHVQPIVSLNLFQQVQAKLDRFEDLTQRIKIPHDDPALVQPYCGLCGMPMKYQQIPLEGVSYYSCSKHGKNRVCTEKIVDMTRNVVMQQISSLDIDTMENECISWLRRQQKNVELGLMKKDEQRNQLALRIVNNYGNTESQSYVNRLIAEQRQLDDSITEVRMLKEKYDLLTAQIHQLTALVTRQLLYNFSRPDEFRTLAQMLIRRLDIYPDRVDICVNFSNYFRREGEIGESVSGGRVPQEV